MNEDLDGVNWREPGQITEETEEDLKIKIQSYAFKEGKRLSDYLVTHPESVSNDVFLGDVFVSFGEFVLQEYEKLSKN